MINKMVDIQLNLANKEVKHWVASEKSRNNAGMAQC